MKRKRKNTKNNNRKNTGPSSPTTYYELLQEVSRVDTSEFTDEQLSEYVLFLEEVTIKAARENFYVFATYMAPVLIPGEFKSGIHINIICKELQRVFENIKSDKPDRKLRISISPGSMKTILASILFPAWCLGRDPAFRILCISHSTKHAERFIGKIVRNLINSDEYQVIFPKVTLEKDSKAGGFWTTTKGGYLGSFGVGSAIAGKRANLALCDDVVSEQTAYSKLERDKINQWYIPGLRTRLLPGGGEINVLTKWHLDDVAGYIEEKDKNSQPWKTVVIPAILDEKTIELYKLENPDLDKKIYKPGASYWPEYKSLDSLLDMKETLPAHQWASLYMQNPIPEEGSIYKLKYFKNWTVEDNPEVSNIVVSLDTAYTEEERREASYSAYSIWGIFPRRERDRRGTERIVGNMILLGAEKGRWSFPELCSICTGLQDQYKNQLDAFLIEDQASGKILIPELRARGLPVIPYNPDRSKEARAWAATPIIEAGRVWINPNKRFTDDFMVDILQFPYGESKDFADTLSQAVLFMRDNFHLICPEYMVYSEEPEDYRDKYNQAPGNGKPRTYWQSVSDTTH